MIVGALAAFVWWTGRVARASADMAAELEARTVELRATRDERARLEVAADRARLSAELHELLPRRLAELARLADDGSRATDTATATATFVDIERESRRTLQEMRALVGVLRDDDGSAPTEPQPTLAHLEALVADATGGDARLTVSGSPRVLPPGVELSAYRIVEHLLDALADASGVEVGIEFGDDALDLTVRGPLRRRGELDATVERARERVQLHRGTLSARTSGGRVEAVAHLPVLAGA